MIQMKLHLLKGRKKGGYVTFGGVWEKGDVYKRQGVMYLGHLVEEGDSKELYANPMHPYTKALLRCV